MVMLLFLVLTSPIGISPASRVDVIERNHYYDGRGRHLYSQWIFWDRAACGSLVVREWKMAPTATDYAVFDHGHDAAGNYRVSYWCQDRKQYIDVAGDCYRETHTQVDPERANKEICPEGDRVPLAPTRPKLSPIPNAGVSD